MKTNTILETPGFGQRCPFTSAEPKTGMTPNDGKRVSYLPPPDA